MDDYSVFDNKNSTTLYPLEKVLLSEKGNLYIYTEDELQQCNLLFQKYIFRRNTQIKDNNNEYIHEYDLIQFKKIIDNKEFIFSGITLLKRGRFVLRDISYAGELLYSEKYEIVLSDLLVDYKDIKILDNSLKIEECQKNIRNKFYFKIINTKTGEVINDCYIDNNCNIYSIEDINDIKTYKLLDNSKILLSTDIYDIDGNMIFYKDNLSFELDGAKYNGIVEYEKGYYYIDNITDEVNNNFDFKIKLCDKFTNKSFKNIQIL